MIIQNSVNHTTHQTRGKQLLSNSSVLNTDISYTPNIKIPTVIEFTTNKRKKTIKPLTTQPLAKNKTVMFKNTMMATPGIQIQGWLDRSVMLGL